MNKKEFYEAPEWGLRVVMVERHYLNGTSGDNETFENGGSYSGGFDDGDGTGE